jgi:hypothetical protein
MIVDPLREEAAAANGPRHWLVVIAMNVLVLAELCIAMARASSGTGDFTAVFLQSFFGMLVPTLALGVIIRRRLASRAER